MASLSYNPGLILVKLIKFVMVFHKYIAQPAQKKEVNMQKIVPHLWFDKEAAEAANWYVSLFENSGITGITTLSETPSGNVEMVDFRLCDFNISAISAGPYFKINPSISFMVSCSTTEEVDRLYKAFIAGGTERMPLGEYPFTKRYAWIEDRYGVNWQIMFDENANSPKFKPVLLFAEEACGKAKEALSAYEEVFKTSKPSLVSYYKPGEADDERAEVNYGEIDLLGTCLVVMDHGFGGGFTFNEAVSFMVLCKDQEEIDYYWDKLSFVPEAEQCGWVKDKFGVSWQIVPDNLNQVMFEGSEEEKKRITEAFLQMKKFDLKALWQAREGSTLV